MPFKTTYSFYLVHRDVFLTFDRVIPRHQELKSAGRLKQRTIELHEIIDGSLDNIIFVSHRWPSPGNPFDAAGAKVRQIQCFLLGNPSAELIFMDWPCLPQVPRTPEENTYFFQTLEVMLTNLVAGVRVVALWDADFNRRFWPSIEQIVGMKTPTKDGFIPATKEQDRMFFINHTPGLAPGGGNDKVLKRLQDRTWRNRSLEDARRTLADDLYAVTNKSDKETNLTVLGWIDSNLKQFQDDPSDRRLRELRQADNFPEVCVHLGNKTVRVPNGTPVEVVSTLGEWAEIRMQSKTGRVKRRNLGPLSTAERLRRKKTRQALSLEGEWSVQTEMEESFEQQERRQGVLWLWFCAGKWRWSALAVLTMGVFAMGLTAIAGQGRQAPPNGTTSTTSPPAPPETTPSGPLPPRNSWLVCPDLHTCSNDAKGFTEVWSIDPATLADQVGDGSTLPGLNKPAYAFFTQGWNPSPMFKGSPVSLKSVADFMKELLSSDPFKMGDKVPYINFTDPNRDGQAIAISQRQLAFIVANVLMNNTLKSKGPNGLSDALERCSTMSWKDKRVTDGLAVMFSLFSFLGILSKELAGGKDGTMLIAARPQDLYDKTPGSSGWKDRFSNIVKSPNICSKIGDVPSGCSPDDFMTGGTNFQALADTPAGYFLGGDPRDERLLCYIQATQDMSLPHFYSEVMAFTFFSAGTIPVPVAFLGVRRYGNKIKGNRGRLCGEIDWLDSSNWFNSDIENGQTTVSIGAGPDTVHANVMTSSFVAVGSVSLDSQTKSCKNTQKVNNMCDEQRHHVSRDVDFWYQAFEASFYNAHMQAAFKGVVKHIGTGPWGSGVWNYGDSQMYFLTMMLATSVLQNVTLDYYMYERFCENSGNQCFVLNKKGCADCIAMAKPYASDGLDASHCGAHGYEDMVKLFEGKSVGEMYSAIMNKVGAPPKQCFDTLIDEFITV